MKSARLFLIKKAAHTVFPYERAVKNIKLYYLCEMSEVNTPVKLISSQLTSLLKQIQTIIFENSIFTENQRNPEVLYINLKKHIVSFMLTAIQIIFIL